MIAPPSAVRRSDGPAAPGRRRSRCRSGRRSNRPRPGRLAAAAAAARRRQHGRRRGGRRGGRLHAHRPVGNARPLRLAVSRTAHCRRCRRLLLRHVRAVRHRHTAPRQATDQPGMAAVPAARLSELSDCRKPGGGCRGSHRQPSVADRPCGRSAALFCLPRVRCAPAAAGRRSPPQRSGRLVRQRHARRRRRRARHTLERSVARMLGCDRASAIGRPIVDAVPALAKTALPKALSEVLKSRTAKALAITVDSRILEVRFVPVAGGATLLMQDVTQRAQADQAVKRSEERLALAAEGANDGLWEWDLRTQELYCLRALAGDDRPVRPRPARADPKTGWIASTPTTSPRFKEALDAHLAGKTDQLVSTSTGSATRTAPTAASCVAAWRCAAPARRPLRIAGSLTDTPSARSRRSGCGPPAFLRSADRPVATARCSSKRWGGGSTSSSSSAPCGRFAALYLDLDRFKVVNDSLGHLVGDELLTAVSRRLESCLRPGDALARLGGDEFAILLNELERREAGQRHRLPHPGGARARRFRSAGARSSHRRASASRSAGAQYASPDEIMRDADTAMYHAKARGKARHELFDADMHARDARPARPRERSAPRGQEQRLRGALPADRAAGDRACASASNR